MFGFIARISSELITQRYGWIRDGVTAWRVFVVYGVLPEFKVHEHVGCSCKPDSVWWVVNAFDVYVERHGGLAKK